MSLYEYPSLSISFCWIVRHATFLPSRGFSRFVVSVFVFEPLNKTHLLFHYFESWSAFGSTFWTEFWSIHFLISLFNPGSWGPWSLSQLTLDERSGAQRTSRKPIIASCFQEFHMQSKQISQTINQCLFNGVFLWHHGLTVPQQQAPCTTVISVVHKVMCIYNAWTKK